MEKDTTNKGTDSLVIGDYYEVYRNLHNGLWSIRNPRNGRVEGHAKSAILQNCKFAVQPKGRAKVLSENRKNVHAFCRGTYMGEVGKQSFPVYLTKENTISISYDPYENETFIDKDNNPITTAEYVVFNTKGKVVIQ